MITAFFFYTLLAMISFIPIVIWAYIFSYIDDNPLNKKRFFVGIVGGSLSVVPILYMDKILNIFDFKYLNTFYFVSQVQSFLSSLEFGLSLALFIGVISLFSLVIGGIVHKFRHILKIYFRNIFVFLVFIAVLSVGIYVFNYLIGFIDFQVSAAISFQNIIFNSFKLIIFYYLVVAFIEEASKHFNFLHSSVLYIDSVKSGVLYAIFVALGFAMIENMLYLYNFYQQVGLSGELLKLYFFRSAFSIIVHVLSSSVVAYYFSQALILYREKDLSLPYLKLFSFGLGVSILLHLVFDVALTLGFTFIMFVYFIGGYLYVSSIFYRED